MLFCTLSVPSNTFPSTVIFNETSLGEDRSTKLTRTFSETGKIQIEGYLFKFKLSSSHFEKSN